VSDLNKVGITLKVNSVDFSTWLQDVYTNKDYQLSLVDHAEARDFENWADPTYYFTYDNPKVQDLYKQSLAATTDTQASDLLTQAARIVSQDMAADWLYNWNSVLAVGSNVSGMPIDNVNARIDAAHLTKSKG
jgi:peptide/nickel transport system substrate-binding protein